MSIAPPTADTPHGRLALLLARLPGSEVKQAKALGMPAPTLNRLRSGDMAITPARAEELAAYFGVRAGWLLFGEGESPAGVADAYRAGRTEMILEMGRVVAEIAAKEGPAVVDAMMDAFGRPQKPTAEGGRRSAEG